MKKQFRLYDLYKAMVDGVKDAINNITCYYSDHHYLVVYYRNGDVYSYNVETLERKRNAIKNINKKLKKLRKK